MLSGNPFRKLINKLCPITVTFIVYLRSFHGMIYRRMVVIPAFNRNHALKRLSILYPDAVKIITPWQKDQNPL